MRRSHDNGEVRLHGKRNEKTRTLLKLQPHINTNETSQVRAITRQQMKIATEHNNETYPTYTQGQRDTKMEWENSKKELEEDKQVHNRMPVAFQIHVAFGGCKETQLPTLQCTHKLHRLKQIHRGVLTAAPQSEE